MSNDQIKIKGTELGDCPFCNGSIAAGQTTEERFDSIIHSIPVCAVFLSTDPLTFVQKCKAARELAQKQP